jgi:2-epi-5-epi-valiolone 7-phosphate 2-epimerase
MFKLNNNNIKLGICQFSLPVDGPYCCKVAAELGFDGIQLDIIHNNKNYLSLSKKFVQEAYLEAGKAYGISFPSIAVRELDEFSMLDEQNNTASLAINTAIEAAEAMKIPIVLIPNFEKSEIKTENDFNNAVEVLRKMCNYAIDKKITIATENLLSVEEMQKLFNKVNCPNLKLYFDTQNHFLHKGYDMPSMLKKLFPLVCEVHVKDGKDKDLSGALLGEGDTDFFGSMEVLKKNNYSGWIITENYYDLKPLSLKNNDPLKLIKKDLNTLKTIFQK